MPKTTRSVAAGGTEYCAGYVDSHGQWNNGFHCPVWGDPSRPYCCGTETDRYCCTRESDWVAAYHFLPVTSPPKQLLQHQQSHQHPLQPQQQQPPPPLSAHRPSQKLVAVKFHSDSPVGSAVNGSIYYHILLAGFVTGSLILLTSAAIIMCYYCRCCLVYRRRKRNHRNVDMERMSRHLMNGRRFHPDIEYELCAGRGSIEEGCQRLRPPSYQADDPPPYSVVTAIDCENSLAAGGSDHLTGSSSAQRGSSDKFPTNGNAADSTSTFNIEVVSSTSSQLHVNSSALEAHSLHNRRLVPEVCLRRSLGVGRTRYRREAVRQHHQRHSTTTTSTSGSDDDSSCSSDDADDESDENDSTAELTTLKKPERETLSSSQRGSSYRTCAKSDEETDLPLSEFANRIDVRESATASGDAACGQLENDQIGSNIDCCCETAETELRRKSTSQPIGTPSFFGRTCPPIRTPPDADGDSNCLQIQKSYSQSTDYQQSTDRCLHLANDITSSNAKNETCITSCVRNGTKSCVVDKSLNVNVADVDSTLSFKLNDNGDNARGQFHESDCHPQRPPPQPQQQQRQQQQQQSTVADSATFLVSNYLIANALANNC